MQSSNTQQEEETPLWFHKLGAASMYGVSVTMKEVTVLLKNIVKSPDLFFKIRARTHKLTLWVWLRWFNEGSPPEWLFWSGPPLLLCWSPPPDPRWIVGDERCAMSSCVLNLRLRPRLSSFSACRIRAASLCAWGRDLSPAAGDLPCCEVTCRRPGTKWTTSEGKQRRMGTRGNESRSLFYLPTLMEHELLSYEHWQGLSPLYRCLWSIKVKG